jgi:hypothetical protein
MVKDVGWIQDRNYFLWKIRTVEEQILHYQQLLEMEEVVKMESKEEATSASEASPLTPSATPLLCCTFRHFCWEHRTHQERLEHCREQLQLYRVKLATFQQELVVYDLHRLASEQQQQFISLGFNTKYVNSLLDWATKHYVPDA